MRAAARVRAAARRVQRRPGCVWQLGFPGRELGAAEPSAEGSPTGVYPTIAPSRRIRRAPFPPGRLRAPASIAPPAYDRPTAPALTAIPADESPGLHLAFAFHVDEPDRLGDEVGAQQLPGRTRDLDLVRCPVRLHAARHVHRVAPEVVEEAAASDHASHDRAGADPDPEPEVALRQACAGAVLHLWREALWFEPT